MKNKKDKNGLTEKMRAFCREYIKDYNGTRACIRSGYGEKYAAGSAHRLLQSQAIQTQIRAEERKYQNRYRVEKEKIIRELSLSAFSDITDYMTFTDDGKMVLTIDQITPEAARALKTVKEKADAITVKGEQKDDVYYSKVQTEITLHDKLEALKLLGQEIGMFKNKCEVTGKDGGPIRIESLTDAELEAIIRADSGGRAKKTQKRTRKPA